MNNLEKMRKKELKELFIEQLQTIGALVKWSNNNGVPGLFGDLIIESSYLENRHLINPDDYMHKHMERKHYLHVVQGYQELISKLNDLKNKYENGYFNQSKETLSEDLENSNLNQVNKMFSDEKGNSIQVGSNDISERDKGNLIQNDDEKGDQNQNRRGGKREGAGRKGFGITKKVSLTLSEETWAEIEKLCEKGNLKQSKVLRDIIEKSLKD